jgi:5-methylcytosine-specific restriction endonuclease McrA
MKPCVVCGEPSPRSRCDEHQPAARVKASAAARGYDAAWTRLSKRARRLQPFCLDCGSTEDLQTDHSPQAWERKAAGKPIRLQDISVRCGPCNRAAGAARSSVVTRGGTPSDQRQDPRGKPQSPLYTEEVS